MSGGALIIGGTGFVGRHLARQLSRRYRVKATGREHDVRHAKRLLGLVSRLEPEIVVNLAAVTTVAESFQDPRETLEIGVIGLLNVLTALRDCGFRGRLLHVSSSEVYGFPQASELPLSEASPLRPMSPYAAAKAAGEMLCRQWAEQAAFSILVARPFTHIGPGQSARFAVAKFANQIAEIMARRKRPVIEVGRLDATRDLTDVRDVARAYELIMHAGHHGQVYNVCSGREVTMRQVLDLLIRRSAVDIEVAENRLLYREAEQQRLRGSYAALGAATGWMPEIPLTQTLADVLAAAVGSREVTRCPTGLTPMPAA
ncbi:MAG: GDP-mannose 4,6-dehydratase [Bauldia sp.]